MRESVILDYNIFLDLAIIIFAAKLLGMGARKIHIPQVAGEIVAGLLIGVNVFGFVKPNDVISILAEIGVIMIMFVAGLETDLKELKSSGVISLLVASFGVLVPLIAGSLLYACFYGFVPFSHPGFIKALFVGTIITATSVSITVEVLREIGKLKTRVGTVILSAAIIDDVIGIVLLTFVCGIKGEGNSGTPFAVMIRTLLFFVFAFLVGFAIYKLFKYLDKKKPHRRRWPIFSLAVCLFLAYAAEKWFGVADITGAFLAGVIFCNIDDSDYIAKKIDINSYMFFSPVFFASIGIRNKIVIDKSVLLFSILFLIIAMACKVLGCGFIARLKKFSFKDSLRIGVGMMARGEVALIITQKGVNMGVLDPKFFTPVILLIIVSSVITPILLKMLYKDEII